MSDDMTVKKILLGKPEGKIKAERSTLIWLECSENGLKSMGVKRWRKKLGDRSAWAIILKEVVVKIKGPYADEEEEEHTWWILPPTPSPVLLAKLSLCCDRQQRISSLLTNSYVRQFYF